MIHTPDSARLEGEFDRCTCQAKTHSADIKRLPAGVNSKLPGCQIQLSPAGLGARQRQQAARIPNASRSSVAALTLGVHPPQFCYGGRVFALILLPFRATCRARGGARGICAGLPPVRSRHGPAQPSKPASNPHAYTASPLLAASGPPSPCTRELLRGCTLVPRWWHAGSPGARASESAAFP